MSGDVSAARLYGVGVGPGDPELVTVKAARLIARRRRDRLPLRPARPLASPARIAAPVPARRPDRGGAGLPGHHRDHRPSRRLPGRDRRVLRRRRASAWPPISTPAATSSCSPRATRSSTAPTCTCTSGWPTATRPRSCPGSPRSAPRRPPSGSRWWSATRCSRCCPAPCRAAELARRLADTDSAAVMKLGRTFDNVRGAVTDAGRARRSTSSAPRRTGQRTAALADVDPASVPYFSIALLPGLGRAPSPARAVATRRAAARRGRRRRHRPGRARLADPAGRRRRSRRRTTSSATAPTSTACRRTRASDRHATDNRVEADRAAHALDLAAAGARVAVVSSRRPGRVRDGRGGAGGRGAGRSTSTSRCACCPG